MFKAKEKSEVEKIIEDSERKIKYYKEDVECLEKRISDRRVDILREQLLVEELEKREEMSKVADKLFSGLLKTFGAKIK